MTENLNQIATESSPASVGAEPDVLGLSEAEFNDLRETTGSGHFRIFNDARPDLAVDIEDESDRDGAPAILFKMQTEGRNSQQWSIEKVKGVHDLVMIVSRHSSLCLTVLNASRKEGAAVVLSTKRGTDDQVWRSRYDSQSQRWVYTCMQSNKCLTAPAEMGASLFQSSSTGVGAPNQLWGLKES